ncbi:hypothetical protein GXW82_01940 [Streptacidiphilus sp. 4-A2]|nr:hypothetical protein [Streptacidiphilus sp. 4-A2]
MAAFVLMALSEAVARLVVIRFRAWRLSATRPSPRRLREQRRPPAGPGFPGGASMLQA